MAQARFFEDPEFLRAKHLMLLFQVVCLVALLFLPILQLELTTTEYRTGDIIITATGYTSPVSEAINVPPLTPPGVLAGLYAMNILLAVAVATRYLKRQAQASLAKTNLIYSLMVLLGFGILAYMWMSQLNTDSIAFIDPAFTPGLILVLVPPMFAILAYIYVRQDLKKLKSAERFW